MRKTKKKKSKSILGRPPIKDGVRTRILSMSLPEDEYDDFIKDVKYWRPQDENASAFFRDIRKFWKERVG